MASKPEQKQRQLNPEQENKAQAESGTKHATRSDRWTVNGVQHTAQRMSDMSQINAAQKYGSA